VSARARACVCARVCVCVCVCEGGKEGLNTSCATPPLRPLHVSGLCCCASYTHTRARTPHRSLPLQHTTDARCRPADKIVRVYSKNRDKAVVQALKEAFGR
jgi:hypothetical protein